MKPNTDLVAMVTTGGMEHEEKTGENTLLGTPSPGVTEPDTEAAVEVIFACAASWLL